MVISSGSTSADMQQHQPHWLMQQLGEVLPAPGLLLRLLLEVLLLRPLGTYNSIALIMNIMASLQLNRGAAAAAEAATGVLRMPLLLTQLPDAVLCVAAAAGCPGLKPQPGADMEAAAGVAEMHHGYALLVLGMATWSGAASDGEPADYAVGHGAFVLRATCRCPK